MQKVEWVIKRDSIERKLRKEQPGLDLSRAILDSLTLNGFAVSKKTSTGCCVFYPSAPVVTAADHDAPTAVEMADVPLLGEFIATDGTDYAKHLKITASTTVILGTTT